MKKLCSILQGFVNDHNSHIENTGIKLFASKQAIQYLIITDSFIEALQFGLMLIDFLQ